MGGTFEIHNKNRNGALHFEIYEYLAKEMSLYRYLIIYYYFYISRSVHFSVCLCVRYV